MLPKLALLVSLAVVIGGTAFLLHERTKARELAGLNQSLGNSLTEAQQKVEELKRLVVDLTLAKAHEAEALPRQTTTPITKPSVRAVKARKATDRDRSTHDDMRSLEMKSQL